MVFEDLVKKISPKLKTISRGLNGRASFFNEDDLYQEALLYLWDKYNSGELWDKTNSFIIQSCLFFLKNYIRKNYKKIDICSVSLNGSVKGGEGTLEEILVFENDVRHYMVPADTNFLKEDIQHRLNKIERKVFLLSLKELTVREIGRRLDMSHVMVVKIKKRIREKCKDLKEEIIF